MNAKSSVERAAVAGLRGESRTEAAEFARARTEVASTGRLDLLARVELLRCASRVASLDFGACAGFDALATDAAAPEQAYARYLPGLATAPDAPNLAGQSALYLVRQLKAYQSGERRHEVMTLMAKGLSADDVANLAAWYASIRVEAHLPP